MSRLEANVKVGKKLLEAAYTSYLNKETGAEEVLLRLVTTFIVNRVSSCSFSTDEVANTAEDVAQDMALYVWQRLPEFTGDEEAFYFWLNKIGYNQGTAMYSEVKAETDNRVPLLVPSDDDSGCQEDNPLLSRRDMSSTSSTGVVIPDHIQGKDRLICAYIFEGLNYKQIGTMLVMTEAAVTMRVQRMKQKAEKVESKQC